MGKIIYIRWLDSATMEGWRQPPQEGGGLSEIETIGFLSYEDKNEIQIVQSISESGNVCSLITIPKSVITKRRIIGKNKKDG